MPTVLTDGTTLTGALLTAALAQSTADALAGSAPLASPALTGLPTAPTAQAGTATSQLATTAFVNAAVVASTAGVASFNGRTGAAVLTSSDVVGALSFTPYNATNPNGYQTAAQVAATVPAGSSSAPAMDGAASAGAAAAFARADHVHPVDTSRYAASNPSGFISAAGAPVQSVAGRAGAVTLSAADIAGTGTNDNAASGHVGEYLIASVASGSAVALNSGGINNVTSLVITAGDWDVTGLVQAAPGSGATLSILYAAASQASSTIPGACSLVYPAAVANAPCYLPAPTIRVSVNAPVTLYLVAAATFSGSVSAYGYIAARRTR